MRLPHLFAALLALASHAAPAEAQTPVPNAYFADGPSLDLSLEELRRGRTALLRSTKTPGPIRLELHSSPGELPISRVAQATLPSHTLTDSLRIRLSAVSDTAAFRPGTYAGTLIVKDATGKSLAEQVVRVTVPAAVTVAPTWTAEIYKGAPLPGLRTVLLPDAASRCATPTQPARDSARRLGLALRKLADRCLRDNVIPLAGVNAPPSLIEKGVVMGVLTDSASGDHAFVWWTGDDGARLASEPISSKGLELGFASFDHPALYKGDIDLTPGVPGGTVTLRVNVTHAMMWPFIAILLGVILSYALQRYLRAKRGILDLQERAAELRATYQQRSQEFANTVQEVPGASRYSIDSSMLKGFEQADEKIRRLERVSGELKEDNPPYQDAVSWLDGLEQDMNRWTAFGDSLSELHADLGETRSAAAAAGRHALAPKGDPEIVEGSERLLHGEPVQRVALAALHQQTDDSRTLLSTWRVLNEQAHEAVEALDRLPAPAAGETDPQRMEAALLLRNAWAHLWRAENNAQLTDADTALTEVSGKVVALQNALPVGAAAVLDSGSNSPVPEQETVVPPVPGAERKTQRIAIDNLAIWRPEPRTPEQERFRRARRRRILYGMGYLALTVMVAALTGLNQLYLDEPHFGTLRDYVLAVLWGFGTKLGMDVVRTTMETRQLPWPDFSTLRRRSQAPVQDPALVPDNAASEM
jgi:hypothetical protein